MKRALVILLLVIATLSSLPATLHYASIAIAEEQYLQPIYERAVELVAKNAGPGAPLVVKPGDCAVLELWSPLDIARAYAWTVKPSDVNASLRTLMLSISIEKIDATMYRVCAPRGAEEALYDLVLVGSAGEEYKLPRSLWIIDRLPRRVRILHMTDLHWGTGPGVTYNGDVNRISAFMLANALNPDIIVWTGDITEIASKLECSLAQIYRYMLLYPYPVFSVPGNHDWGGDGGLTYNRYIGPRRWVRVIGDKLLIVGIYTVPYTSESEVITWDEIAFLESALANYSYVPYKIVVTHYPMFYYQGELTTRYDDEAVLKPYRPPEITDTPVSSYWSGNMTAFRYVLKLIEDYNVTLALFGHIHQDQFVKYTSTRTNTTTYFITLTTAAHGTSMYQGILMYELDLETGELSFPAKPPTFIGFANRTAKIAYNSIPVSNFESRLIKTRYGYYLKTTRIAEWLPGGYRVLLALPWAKEARYNYVVYSERGSRVDVLSSIYHDNTLFLLLNLDVPTNSTAGLLVYLERDVEPPSISYTYRGYPVLNRTFTLYVDISDDVSGVDLVNIVVEFNGTSIDVSYTPSTLTEDLNRVSLTLRLLQRGVNATPTLLTVRAVDNTGKSVTKRYIVVFYPPGVSPPQEPVYELVETPTPTTPPPTPSPTLTPTPTPTPTPTSTPTPTPTPTPKTPPATPSTLTPTQTATPQTPTLITQTTPTATTRPPYEAITIAIILVVLVILVAFVLLRARR
jgi:hypothetical protein